MAPAETGWGDAPTMMDEAGAAEIPSYYGSFTEDDEKAALTVPMRIQAAWAANDPEMFAEVFAENGSLLLGDEQLTSREQIRGYMTEAFGGDYRGASVKGWPVDLKFLGDEVAMIVTEGGIVAAGEDGIAPERRIRAVWIVHKRQRGELELVSHQSSPVAG